MTWPGSSDASARRSSAIPQTQALAFYDAHAGRLITSVDDTTRRAIVAIVRNALTNGTPYTAVEGALIQRFEALRQYQPQKHIRTRARLIAVTETGQAYERGKQSTVHRAEAAGVRFEKSWVTVGDDRVSRDCRRNEDGGMDTGGQPFPQRRYAASGASCLTVCFRPAGGAVASEGRLEDAYKFVEVAVLGGREG